MGGVAGKHFQCVFHWDLWLKENELSLSGVLSHKKNSSRLDLSFSFLITCFFLKKSFHLSRTTGLLKAFLPLPSPCECTHTLPVSHFVSDGLVGSLGLCPSFGRLWESGFLASYPGEFFVIWL